LENNVFLKFAAISGFLSVALGAFGAHGLKKRLSEDMLAVYQTGVEYQFMHTLALLAVSLFILHWGKSTALTIAGFSFIAGIIIFSGSLYALSLSGIKILGAITPIGGLAFLIGWASLLVAAFKAG
jgi:uncharacterized membrane protein YgdD (TMEM256/DUF423 family)